MTIKALTYSRSWRLIVDAIRDECLELFKDWKRVFGFLSALIGAFNLIAIIEAMHPVVLGDFLSTVAHVFRSAQAFVFSTLYDFGIPQLLKYFQFHLSLPHFWRDIVTLLMLYDSAHIKESFSKKVKHKLRAVFIRLLGALGSIFVAIWVSTTLNNLGVTQRVNMVISVGAGIVMYRVVFSFQFSMDQWLDHSSGSNLTFESLLGFPRFAACASLRDARRKIHHRFVGRSASA